MPSSFLGLETTKRALLTQTLAMQTAGHNIANASTVGYTRQRVNLSATRPQEAVGMQRSTTVGQIGTGVQADSITRIRENYLDTQYRRENQGLGYWKIRNANLDSIQAILNEPSDDGIRGVVDDFWNSWEVLNRDPTLLSARVDVIAKATNMVDTFKQVDESLTALERDIDSSIATKVSAVNTMLANIAQLNDYIRRAESLGANANDYRDQRDVLLDQLSSIVNIEYAETPAGDFTLSIAGTQVVANDQAATVTADIAANATSGELAGYVQAKADIAQIRDELNALVKTLVGGAVTVTLANGYTTSQPLTANNDVTLDDGTVIPAGTIIPAGSKIVSSVELTVNGINGLHRLGYGTSDPTPAGIDFFTTSDGSTDFNMSNIRLNPVIANDTSKIAASGRYETLADGTKRTIKGNGDIAYAITTLRDKSFAYSASITNLTSGTIDDYFRAVTSQLGSTADNALRNMNNQQELVDAADTRRQEVSGVSLDEEMTDVIKFQRAYNAAARAMTTIDEMLDRIINQTGRVGL